MEMKINLCFFFFEQCGKESGSRGRDLGQLRKGCVGQAAIGSEE